MNELFVFKLKASVLAEVANKMRKKKINTTANLVNFTSPATTPIPDDVSRPNVSSIMKNVLCNYPTIERNITSDR
jgi:hypothetical protein